MAKKTSRREKGITLIALIVTIIVLLILAGVTISMATSGSGVFGRAKNAADVYRASAKNENDALDSYSSEIEKADKEIEKEGTEGGSGSETGNGNETGGGSETGSGNETGGGNETGSENITYTDSAGKTQPLTKGTPAGTKIGTTANIDGQTLDWYLFDVSDDGKTAYLVSTPTYWVPDTTKEVSGALVPKLVSDKDETTIAMSQAIKKSTSSVTYTPSANAWNYFKSVNSQWSAQRESTAFASLKENEQAACYLADADVFAGIKDQVNNANGNLKGKVQSLVGGASIEQWCNAYNKRSVASSSKITCAYQATDTPGYIYNVNGTALNSGWNTKDKTIVGNDIYGAAYTNNRSDNSKYPFSSCWWWLASPSSCDSIGVCSVSGDYSNLNASRSYDYDGRFSLFASVSL